MSFLIRNIHTYTEFIETIEDRRPVLIRFGHGYTPTCKRMDLLLHLVNRDVNHYINIVAYDTMEISNDTFKRYAITKDTLCTLVFFYNKAPIYIAFNHKPAIQINEPIPNKAELLSLIVFVYQGVTHEKKIINVPTEYAEKRHPRRRETKNKP
ncbi:U5 snRNP protein, DIM1 family [Nematocida sp. AWRm80]|nr:U5 snRNP protein, DIM1 family [Nematocida sp. AWRm80]